MPQARSPSLGFYRRDAPRSLTGEELGLLGLRVDGDVARHAGNDLRDRREAVEVDRRVDQDLVGDQRAGDLRAPVDANLVLPSVERPLPVGRATHVNRL